MNNFTELIKEARKNYDSNSLLSSEISQYLNKVNKVIPKQVQDVIYLTQRYKLNDSASIEEIRTASKSSLKNLSKKYNIPGESIEMFWKMLKELKTKIRLLPQYQSKAERESIQLGKMSMDDLTIDLDTPAGRNAAAKMYMPVIYKVVSGYVGKSSLSRQELMSAALQGFTNAMNDWRRGEDETVKKVTFKTYAAIRAQQQILDDMSKLSHTLSGTNWYAVKTHGGDLDGFSIDSLMTGDDEVKQDHIGALGVDDKYFAKDEDKLLSELYKLLERQFNQRTMDVFYRYFGLNGYKREKSKEIAKSLGLSEGAIRNSYLNKIISFLKSNKKAMELLSDLQDAYNESLMVELVGLTTEEINEALVNDDMFILLEELNMWKNKDVFNNSLSSTLNGLSENDSESIKDLLENDFDYLDSRYKKNKKVIIKFLQGMYPTESISYKSDVALLEMMQEFQTLYKKHN